MMVALGRAGMDVARLNFSHGSHEDHAMLLRRLRTAGKELDRPFAILQDLQGPKIRVGSLPKEGIVLTAGSNIIFTTDPKPAPGDIPVTLPYLHRDIARNARILLDDGLLECQVKKVDGRRIHTTVVVGGKLTSHKGLNLPGTSLRIPALSEKDRADALFGVKQGVDFMALSFVRTPEDVKDLRTLISKTPKGKKIRIVGKIEKPEALENFEKIMPLLDVIMVARGDLGIETPASDVPVVQKQLISRCRELGKPVIVATQMLDSMIRNPRATRAEISDVANAVMDHADAVMLSGETATGAYPLEAVRTMTETIRSAEASPFDNDSSVSLPADAEAPMLIAAGARILSDAMGRAPIIVHTVTGHQARLISSYRPECDTFAFTEDETVARQLSLSWGVTPILLKKQGKLVDLARMAITDLRKKNMLPKNGAYVVVGGQVPGASGKQGSAARIQVMKE